MIKRIVFHIIWVIVVIILVVYSINYKGGDEAMVAQVESQVTAISYQKPILIKQIYVTPGQVVDSGDLLIEVDRPDLELNLEKSLSEKTQLEKRLLQTELDYINSQKLLDTQYEIDLSELVSQIEEIEFELDAKQKGRVRMDSISNYSFNSSDELLSNKLELSSKQLNVLERGYKLEKAKLENSFTSTVFVMESDLLLLEKEICELLNEKSQLIKYAEKKCTVGNLFVQLNELVPPYQTLMSLYDLNPTLIKAFIKERGIQEIKIGLKVMVESINRDYQIEGKIIEIGSRITAYPEKINPLVSQKSYGQEIFINIPAENDFLNGEKVYVYVVEDKN